MSAPLNASGTPVREGDICVDLGGKEAEVIYVNLDGTVVIQTDDRERAVIPVTELTDRPGCPGCAS